jgi:hypothetical protein
MRGRPTRMNIVQVREGSTGVLFLKDRSSHEERYVPNYDLDPVLALLARFESLRDRRGVCIRECYWSDGINWFPTVVNYLFGRIFTPHVRYQPLIEAMFRGALHPRHQSHGDFWRITSLLTDNEPHNPLAETAFNTLVALNNELAIARSSAEVMFFRFTPSDFRTSRAKAAFDELGACYLEAVIGDRPLIGPSLRGRQPYYFCGYACQSNDFVHEFVLDDLDGVTRSLFQAAIRKIEVMISGSIREFRGHCQALRGARIKTLYGIDDTQVIYPLLYACQRLGIHTVAHQHGAAYNKRHASYVMEGIQPGEYRWFDTLITWSAYWRDRLYATTRCVPQEVVVGCDLFDLRFQAGCPNGRPPGSVLVPYEFLTNTFEVGRFMARLMDRGFRVHLKVRSDEDVESQIEAYCLSAAHRERLAVVADLTPEVLGGIDIVAGTSSTLVYQLLACRKITWVLETDYRYLDDLVDAGYARLVRYADLDRLDDSYFELPRIDQDYLFSSATLKETIARTVLCRN